MPRETHAMIRIAPRSADRRSARPPAWRCSRPGADRRQRPRALCRISRRRTRTRGPVTPSPPQGPLAPSRRPARPGERDVRDIDRGESNAGGDGENERHQPGRPSGQGSCSVARSPKGGGTRGDDQGKEIGDHPNGEKEQAGGSGRTARPGKPSVHGHADDRERKSRYR
jgi:hypothetical protein